MLWRDRLVLILGWGPSECRIEILCLLTPYTTNLVRYPFLAEPHGPARRGVFRESTLQPRSEIARRDTSYVGPLS